jgi:hypothetical protein
MARNKNRDGIRSQVGGIVEPARGVEHMGGSTFYHVLQIRVIQISIGFENDAEGENYPSVSYFQPSGVHTVNFAD